MIYFTSDLHLGHNKEFLYQPRGFTNIEDHDKAIVEKWNNKITDNDDVYVLGDLMLGEYQHGIDLIKTLKGKIHIVYGNHDTNERIKLYNTLPNVVEAGYGLPPLKYKKFRFWLTHYPTMTANFGEEHLNECLINLFAHTHQKDYFYEDKPWMFHVGLDSNNNELISIDEVLEKIKQKWDEYIKDKNTNEVLCS